MRLENKIAIARALQDGIEDMCVLMYNMGADVDGYTDVSDVGMVTDATARRIKVTIEEAK